MQAVDFFRSRIDAMINMNDPLAVLASRLPWSQIEGAVAQKFEHQNVGMKIKHIVVDLGFRGVDAANPDKEIIHRGKFKSLSKQQKRWLKRRTAVEPAIGHLKSDHRMDRCWLQGSLGDALHTLGCAAGYNLRWLMRAIARLGIGPVFLRLLQAALSKQHPKASSYGSLGRSWMAGVRNWVGAAVVKKTVFGHAVLASF